jgi:hypothetical protein
MKIQHIDTKRSKPLQEGLGEDAGHMEADHEVQMARADLYKIAKYAVQLHRHLRDVTEAEGLEGWVQAKITKAADYIGSVYHYLDAQDREFVLPQTDYGTMFEDSETKPDSIKQKIQTPGLGTRARDTLLRAYARFPQSRSDLEALVNFVDAEQRHDRGEISRLDLENQNQFREIGQIERETEEIAKLEAQLADLRRRLDSQRNSLGETTSGSIAAVSSTLTPRVIRRKKS